MTAGIPQFPFTAIVGQEQMKTALLVNVINPAVGGVLIRGEKGTAKSTAVRSLAELLPMQVEADCPYSCDPADQTRLCQECRQRLERGQPLSTRRRRVRVVELPLGATEDRLLGSLDLENALAQGSTRFSPGILAAANRQILYVDEVNLLDDHLVDSLLDAAAMGVNTVERESVSIAHPARFTLVGTMNPEEGELRPQLTDRFGLCAAVAGLKDSGERQLVIERRLAFEANPAGFAKSYEEENRRLTRKIEKARALLPSLKPNQEVLSRVVAVSLGLGVDGHRGDLTLLKAALTLAALAGDGKPGASHVDEAALLALPHRLRRRPLEEMDFDIADRIKRI